MLKTHLYCKYCDKYYSSKNSLCNHNKRFHKNNNNDNNSIICSNNAQCMLKNTQKYSKPTNFKKYLTCEYCNKVFNYTSSKSYHKKVCKEKEKYENIKTAEIENLKNKITKLEEENKELKNTNTVCPDINKINKQLSQLQNYQNFSNNNNINSNNIINNFNLISFNEKDIIHHLTNEDKLRIIKEPVRNIIEKIVEIVHCEKYIKFKNIIITNLKDKYAYIFDGNRFVPISKDDALNTLITNRKYDIDEICGEYEDKIKPKTQQQVIKLIDDLEDNQTPYFNEDKKYKSMRTYKKERISLILYNNREKMMTDVMNNISMLLSNEELSKTDLEDMVLRKKEYDFS